MRFPRFVGASELPATLAQVLETGGDPLVPLPDDPAAARRIRNAVGAAAVTEPDAAVVVATSGSTGEPRPVVLSRRALVAAAQATSATLGGNGTWVCALPVHYVAGLMVLVRAIASGTQAVMVKPDLSNLPTATGRWFVSLVPAQLHKAVRHQQTAEVLASYQRVLIGGAGLPEQERRLAEQAGIAITTTYGMSETCGGVVYDGVPLPKVNLSIGTAGRIAITTPTAFSGYLRDPAKTAAVLHGSTVVTNDRGRWCDDRLVVTGRLDDVVVVGGVNVDMAALQRIVDRELGAEQVVVLSQPDPRWGSRIVAATASGDLSIDQVRLALADHAEPAALPQELRLVPVLPRTPSGKVDLAGLGRTWNRG